jgi:two-component system phosphate regulon sensor histidine kinase PhoR
MFHTIRWRIAIPYVILILLATAALTVYFSNFMRQTHLADLRTQLTAEARLVGDVIQPLLAEGGTIETIDPLAKRWGKLLDARVTVIRTDGVVLGDSHEDPATMENHLFRPEVQQALAEGTGISTRHSKTVGYDMMYVAIPVDVGGQVVGIARVSLPLTQIEATVARLRNTVVVASIITALLAGLLALFIAERIAHPVRQLTGVVQRMTEGDLNARLLPIPHGEVGVLTQAFNQMAGRLQGMITTLVEERSRLTAVLDSMADGVVITDGEGRVRLINPAAARLLRTDEEAALGRPFAQVACDHRLIGLWQQCYEQNEEQFASVEIGRQGSFLQAIATPLRDAGPQASLIILQDLTRVRRLEIVRRDFISNISHELRTPLASLQALVDTLRDGALDDPPAARHFLDRMETEVEALTQMVQELLELSRIESGQVSMRLIPTPVADVVFPPVERLRPQAERAGLSVTVDLPPDLPPVLADAERAQQVITNLVHNAIKFTPSGGQVTLSAQPVGEEVMISVRDTGVGIPADDLPRIFERFYKADRARSGGGTGLGLSIAKHIVQAHGGRIWAESVEGKGSTFYVALPALTPR